MRTDADFPVLQSSRLSLTALNAGDRDGLLAILGDESVTRYLGCEPLQDLEEAADLIREYERRRQAGDELRWAIRVRGEERLAGMCVLHEPYSPRRRAELGYMLAPDRWGQGFAAEAVEAVISYGFSVLGLNRIEALTFAENSASRALLRKLGFAEEGIMRQHAWEKGRYWDDVIHALLADDFRAQGR